MSLAAVVDGVGLSVSGEASERPSADCVEAMDVVSNIDQVGPGRLCSVSP